MKEGAVFLGFGYEFKKGRLVVEEGVGKTILGVFVLIGVYIVISEITGCWRV